MTRNTAREKIKDFIGWACIIAEPDNQFSYATTLVCVRYQMKHHPGDVKAVYLNGERMSKKRFINTMI